MQDENKDLKLSPESVQRAIKAIQERSSEVNLSTIAEELKVAKSVIYNDAEIIKLIIAASDGDFGMDMQTSLDLAWQLKKLAEDDSELIENLASKKSALQNSEIGYNNANNFFDLSNRNERIVNFVGSSPTIDSCYGELSNMSWKDLETIYYFKVSSLRDHAKALFGSDSTIDRLETIEASVANTDSVALQSLSYGSLGNIESNKQQRGFSESPFARLKSSRSRIGRLPGEALLEPIFKPEPKPEIKEGKIRKEKSPTMDRVGSAPATIAPLKDDKTTQPSKQEIETPITKKAEDKEQLKEELDTLVTEKAENKQTQEDINKNASELPPAAESKTAEKMVIPAARGEFKIYKEDEADLRIELDWGGGSKKDTKGNLASVLKTSEKPVVEKSEETEIKLISLLKNESLSVPVDDKAKVNIETGAAAVYSQINTGDMLPIQKDSEKILDKKEDGDSYKESNKESNTVSGDELRNLIQSHIKNAAEQMAESAHAYSIGTGKEFEVFLNNPARSKFVGSSKPPDSNSKVEENTNLPKTNTFKPRILPPDVRKSCLLLGVRTDNITYEQVQESWKKAIAAPGVHPDLGGDTELAVYLNTAKDILVRWLEAQAPKLGKKFGQYKKEKNSEAKKDTKKDQQ